MKLAKSNYKYDQPTAVIPTESGIFSSPRGASVENTATEDLNISDNIPGKKAVYSSSKGGDVTVNERQSKIIPMVQPTIRQAEVKGSQVIAQPTIKRNKNIHRVVKGETLYRLSKRYNISVNQLKSINKLKNNIIEIDQELVVKAN